MEVKTPILHPQLFNFLGYREMANDISWLLYLAHKRERIIVAIKFRELILTQDERQYYIEEGDSIIKKLLGKKYRKYKLVKVENIDEVLEKY